MGAPLFEHTHVVKQHQVTVFSANFLLYGDMSQRVISIISMFAPQIEVYSIDEAFICLDEIPDQSFQEYGETIRNTIYQWTGIPVSVGIGPTKTLAKAASELAKKGAGHNNVLTLLEESTQSDLLSKLEVGDVWGIGRKWSQTLQRHGIYTAQQLRQTNDRWVRKQLGIVGLRTALELQGIVCLRLEPELRPRKGIISSRSFGRPVSDIKEMKEAVSQYASRASEKLREQNSIAATVSVYITTNRFNNNDPQYSNSITIPLPIPTDYTPEIIRHALTGLTRIFRPGYRYKKAVVGLQHITSSDLIQLNLFTKSPNISKRTQIMSCVDTINQAWGDHIIHSAAAGIKRDWKMKQDQRSPRYTTHWEELPVVKAH